MEENEAEEEKEESFCVGDYVQFKEIELLWRNFIDSKDKYVYWQII